MNEVLIVFLLLLISTATFGLIFFILKVDKKVLEFDSQVTEFKNTDFTQLKKIVAILNTLNKNIKLGKIKYYFDIMMSVITTINIFFIFKKVFKLVKKNKKQKV